MNIKEKIISGSNTISSCVVLRKEVEKIVPKNIKRVAILSNFTVKGLADCLKVKSFLSDIFLEIYEGEYGQWKQEILGSKLYEFNPDIIFLILDTHGIDNDILYGIEETKKKEINKPKIENEIFQFINCIKEKTRAKIVVSNSVKIWPPVMGIFDNKLKDGYYNLVDDYNNNLSNTYKEDGQVFIFNFNEWLGYIGKESFWCNKYYFVADMRLSPDAIPLLATELTSYLIPLAGKKKKCIVLDLDNTLWGGIIGEDGLSGIKLSPTGDGQQFYYFQKLLLSLNKKGILLAINSKNNENDVREVFAKHPYMVLKENNIVSSKINWNNKAENIQVIAKDLNIGLDSFLFIDDDLSNRELVKQTLPEVGVLDLPSDSTRYVNTLLNYKGFNTFEFTDEDKKRNEMYLQDKKRNEYKNISIDIDVFLKGLNLCISIKEVDDFLVPRISQLTQKTNQFNLTTKRYHENDIKRFIKSGDKLWALNVSDKFGEYGITGFCLAKNNKNFWEIDSMLLSCRILGKKIEEQFFGFILSELKRLKQQKVIGMYKVTAKNSQVKDFYKLFGFEKVKTSELEDTWEIDLNNYTFNPHNFIKIIT